jgi:hypothetical protein
VVLDNANQPMSNILCAIKGSVNAAVTDAQGQFILSRAPVGAITLIIDAKNRGYPGEWHDLTYNMVTVAGRDNRLDRPIYMVQVDTNSAALVGGDQDVVLHLKNFPGATLTIFAHSLRGANGQPITNQVTWTQVNAERIPMAPPQGSQPILTTAILPAGYRFNPPARMCIPNSSSLPAGQILEMYSFDHDLGNFVSVGTATVSGDASTICSDPGFGVMKSGWHPVVPPPPPPTCAPKCPPPLVTPCSTTTYRLNVIDRKNCIYTCIPTVTKKPNGTACDDGSGCGVKTCQNGVCVTDSSKADGTTCDDGLFCTENDKCKGGDCKGEPKAKKTLASTTLAVNLEKAFAPVKGFLRTVFGDGAPDFSLQVAFNVGKTEECCEKIRGPVINKTFAGQGTGGVKGEFPTPLSVNLGRLAKAGIFIDLAVGVSGQGQGTLDDCEHITKGTLSGTVSLGGAISVKIKTAGDIVNVTGSGAVGLTGGIAGEFTPGKIEFKFVGQHNGVVASITAEFFDGLIEVARNYTLIEPGGFEPVFGTVAFNP